MDLDVHRAMLHHGVQRAKARLRGEGNTAAAEALGDFKHLWLGNWLTDMNQLTCFVDLAGGEVSDPGETFQDHVYRLPQLVIDEQDPWRRLFRALWEEECARAAGDFPRLQGGGPELVAAGEGAERSLQIIGAYVPCDHFDVVDLKGARADDPAARRDAHEFLDRGALVTETARRGVFEHALHGWLEPAFRQDAPLPERLRCLGHATHVLQDFFAHSNFVELLLEGGAQRRLFRGGLSRALTRRREGTFRAFGRPSSGRPEDIWLMTGRFDRIDTLATLLKIYHQGLIARFRDLEAAELAGAPPVPAALLFDVLFGTFSNNPFAKGVVACLREVDAVRDGLQTFERTVAVGAIHVAEWVAKRFLDERLQGTAQLLGELLEMKQSKDYDHAARAGRLMGLECVIERELRQELDDNQGKLVLPHHTLIAKDNDISQPEDRLAYKLACLMATEVTADVIHRWAAGGQLADVEAILHQRYRHPREHLEDPRTAARLAALAERLYGDRWWDVAADEEGRLLDAAPGSPGARGSPAAPTAPAPPPVTAPLQASVAADRAEPITAARAEAPAPSKGHGALWWWGAQLTLLALLFVAFAPLVVHQMGPAFSWKTMGFWQAMQALWPIGGCMFPAMFVIVMQLMAYLCLSIICPSVSGAETPDVPGEIRAARGPDGDVESTELHEGAAPGGVGGRARVGGQRGGQEARNPEELRVSVGQDRGRAARGGADAGLGA